MTLKERAAAAFDDVERELRALSRWMYENPETAYEEFEASRRLAEFLAGSGFRVTKPA